MKHPGRIVCFALFLLTALFPITGSTIMNSEDIRARLVLEAYRRAFPDRVEAIEFIDDDWTATIGETRFFWARGRIVPEKDRRRWEEYRPYVFYTYPDKQRDPREYTDERIAALRAMGESEARRNGHDQHPAFRAALYESSTRGGAERRLRKVPLFGRSVSVHERIVANIRRIDEAVRSAAKRDEETAAFLADIGSLGAYNWREIRGTARRSYHSWGLAVDVQPRRRGNSVLFWEWERDRNPDWMLVPLERRWTPPKTVIDAFEKEGFAWGGKWDFYDTMHFEYRPELHQMKRVFAALGGADAERKEAAAIFGVGGGDLERLSR